MTEQHIRVDFEHVYQVPDSSPTQHFASLREVGGARRVMIWMQRDVADAIAAGARGVRTGRPMTHDLLVETIGAVGELYEIRISLRQPVEGQSYGTFLAEMWVHTPDGEGRRFDARPSDALAVALRTQPRPVILVAEDALVEYGPPPGAVSVDQLEDSG